MFVPTLFSVLLPSEFISSGQSTVGLKVNLVSAGEKSHASHLGLSSLLRPPASFYFLPSGIGQALSPPYLQRCLH